MDLLSNLSKFALVHHFSFLFQETGAPNISLKTDLAVSAYPCDVSIAKNNHKLVAGKFILAIVMNKCREKALQVTR